jgi:hypothetical protein
MGLAKGIDEYLNALRELYRALHAETGCRVIIDSSKAPSHSYLLRAAHDVDLYVLHLVRDARAVAYSWDRQLVRRDYDPANPIAMVRFSTFRSAVKWTYANMTAELLRKGMGPKILTVRYEDFLASPQRTLSRITRHVDEPSDVLPFTSERELHLDATHTVWGNPSRLRTGAVELRLDAEWQEKMSAGRRALVTSVAWPLLRKYAYRTGRVVPSTGPETPFAASR